MVNVWVRFSGLPIEYYDANLLTSIGNRIGRTVKVDKNTLMQERGKYARLCVQVDLSQPLLAMFTIKDRTYKVEYEGLHLLCLGCGKFGHYVEGCPMKTSKTDGHDGNNDGANKGENQHVNSNDQAVGPWTVVTKQRRQRKNTKPGEENKDEATVTGSRFAILGNNKGEDTLEEDAATDTVISEAPIINEKLAPKATMQVRDDAFATRANSGVKRGYSSMQNLENSQGIMGKSTRDNKLGTRGTASFKGKGDQATKKSSENIVDRMAKTSTKAINVSNNKSRTKIGDQHVENPMVISDNNNQLAQNNIVHSTLGRPPDLATTALPLDHANNTNNMEGEDFVDAIDQVNDITGSMDATDMEVVGETPGLDQQQ
jgi:hypothetical protein